MHFPNYYTFGSQVTETVISGFPGLGADSGDSVAPAPPASLVPCSVCPPPGAPMAIPRGAALVPNRDWPYHLITDNERSRLRGNIMLASCSSCVSSPSALLGRHLRQSIACPTAQATVSRCDPIQSMASPLRRHLRAEARAPPATAGAPAGTAPAGRPDRTSCLGLWCG